MIKFKKRKQQRTLFNTFFLILKFPILDIISACANGNILLRFQVLLTWNFSVLNESFETTVGVHLIFHHSYLSIGLQKAVGTSGYVQLTMFIMLTYHSLYIYYIIKWVWFLKKINDNKCQDGNSKVAFNKNF